MPPDDSLQMSGSSMGLQMLSARALVAYVMPRAATAEKTAPVLPSAFICSPLLACERDVNPYRSHTDRFRVRAPPPSIKVAEPQRPYPLVHRRRRELRDLDTTSALPCAPVGSLGGLVVLAAALASLLLVACRAFVSKCHRSGSRQQAESEGQA